MKISDFWRTPNFPQNEVENTGAKIEDVELLLMLTIQSVRTGLGVIINLIKNGITTGGHISGEHPLGIAIDFCFGHYIDPKRVIIAMIRAGFNGIGVYKNAGGFYSYHGDLREEFGCWYREYNDDGTHEPDIDLFNSKLWK